MTDKSAAITCPRLILRFFRDSLDAIDFYNGHPCKVGEFIEIDQPNDSVFLNTLNVYRVDKIAWMYTEVTCLANGERVRWHNSSLCRYRSMTCWSYCPVRFEIVLPLPVGTGDPLSLFLFESKIRQFANENPGEWRKANTFFCDQTAGGLRVMIEHNEVWGQLKLVLKSREKLIAYCKELTEEIRPADAIDDGFAITVFP
ncbi:hypothetical protein FisN_14Lh104 [Fistulifera solaris]|uniref:Uncharacterized protein n=1 Tax=Fistulifera solaris TaxID=1519565 RepID=A0A1Z5J9L6_FISSO|nr:hypothetical protein FisN_14Lh104 [Fistulifera solaris]|eukprot:GAX10694.1 hypothetical protein FisN_14Lh104 [Fistulifera solaris]